MVAGVEQAHAQILLLQLLAVLHFHLAFALRQEVHVVFCGVRVELLALVYENLLGLREFDLELLDDEADHRVRELAVHLDDVEEHVVDSQCVREDASRDLAAQRGRDVLQEAFELLLLILRALHGDEVVLDLSLRFVGQLEVLHGGASGVDLLLEVHALAVHLADEHSHDAEDVRVHHRRDEHHERDERDLERRARHHLVHAEHEHCVVHARPVAQLDVLLEQHRLAVDEVQVRDPLLIYRHHVVEEARQAVDVHDQEEDQFQHFQ